MKKGQKILFNFRQKLADRGPLPTQAVGVYIGRYFCKTCDAIGPPTGDYCDKCGKRQRGCDIEDSMPMLHSVCLEGVGKAKVYDWEIQEIKAPDPQVVNDVKYVVVRLKLHGDNNLVLTRNLHTVSSGVEVVQIVDDVEDAIAWQHDMSKKEPENCFAILLSVQRIEK